MFSALGLEKEDKAAISHNTLLAAISRSRYRDDLRRSPAAVSFVKSAVRLRRLEIVKLILICGVSIHQRVDHESPLEFAVSNFSFAHESLLQDEADSKEIMMALLSHVRAEEMEDFNFHGLGFSLMHMVAETHSDRQTHTYWLLKELMRLGVKIDGEAKFSPGCTSLLYHLSRRAFKTAEILLDLRANPFANRIFDLIHKSLVAGGVSFLKRLLRYFNETRTPVPWNSIYLWRGFEKLSENVREITPVHVIACCGLGEILEFYIDEDLLEDTNVVIADGYAAVHIAAWKGRAAIIHQLHRTGASLDVPSDDGSTALHIAARYQKLSVAKILLELGVQSSMDAYAMTPRMYASALNDENMIKLIDQYFPVDVPPSNFADEHFISWKRKKYLARSFENAIEKNNLEECQRLHHAGCSLDAYMSRFRGSPLMKALINEQLQIIEWFLQCEATTLEIASDADGTLSTIECAIGRVSLNPILERLLRLYAKQGGDIISDYHFPFRRAIMYHNEEGLRIFLEFVKKMSERIR